MSSVYTPPSPAFRARMVRPKDGEAIVDWLERWTFDRFITLASNDPLLSAHGDDERGLVRMRKLLREWDARVNRKVVGPKWQTRPEDRIWGFFFLEKPASNPHWHGLVQFFPPWPDARQDYEDRFDKWAPIYWKELVLSGTVDVQNITNQRGVAEYVAKSVGYALSFQNFVVPDEF